MDTLQNIVKGLNKAGFSEKDYKLADTTIQEQAQKQESIRTTYYFPRQRRNNGRYYF